MCSSVVSRCVFSGPSKREERRRAAKVLKAALQTRRAKNTGLSVLQVRPVVKGRGLPEPCGCWSSALTNRRSVTFDRRHTRSENPPTKFNAPGRFADQNVFLLSLEVIIKAKTPARRFYFKQTFIWSAGGVCFPKWFLNGV